MRAIFSPGPSYQDPRVREYAGWVHILDLYKQGLEEIGYEVFVPSLSRWPNPVYDVKNSVEASVGIPAEVIDASSTVAKITSYDLVAASQLPLGDDIDLFLGPPGYSLAQIMKLKAWFKGALKDCFRITPVIFTYVWNNADWWRDSQLAEEYKLFNIPYDLSPTWRWINKTALQMSDKVISCSPWVTWTHSKIVPDENIVEAFWGVDSKLFTPAIHKPEGFRVLFVGGDPVRKGLLYLLRAFGELKNAELWIVGCEPFADVPENVKQFGMLKHSEMPEIYRQCHVLVCPTLEDGIALCVQEAMASGLPVVCTPEVAEVFGGGRNHQLDWEGAGIEVGYRDQGSISKALKHLQDHEEERNIMSKKAREVAEKQTWEWTKEQFKARIKKEMRL